MAAKLPILACTDPNTDVGTVIKEGGFGWWCPSNDTNGFKVCVLNAMENNFNYGVKEKNYLKKHFSVESNVSKLCSF